MVGEETLGDLNIHQLVGVSQSMPSDYSFGVMMQKILEAPVTRNNRKMVIELHLIHIKSAVWQFLRK